MQNKPKLRSQSAMEYLMTYGWAILIIAVVLGALYYLGIFGSATSGPRAQPGSCQVIRPLGPGTTSYINLEGVCTGQLPQFVASFDGLKPGYISIGSSASLSTITSQITVSAWINAASPLTTEGVVAKRDPTGTPSDWQLYVDSSGYLHFTFWSNQVLQSGIGGSNGQLATGRWYYVVATYNGVAGTYYINGALDKSASMSGTIDANSIATSIGAATSSGYQPFNGFISNVQIYNTSLDAGAVQSLYAEGIGGAPIPSPYLVGWWPLNGNAKDYGGNGNNGVPTNVVFTSTWTR